MACSGDVDQERFRMILKKPRDEMHLDGAGALQRHSSLPWRPAGDQKGIPRAPAELAEECDKLPRSPWKPFRKDIPPTALLQKLQATCAERLKLLNNKPDLSQHDQVIDSQAGHDQSDVQDDTQRKDQVSSDIPCKHINLDGRASALTSRSLQFPQRIPGPPTALLTAGGRTTAVQPASPRLQRPAPSRLPSFSVTTSSSAATIPQAEPAEPAADHVLPTPCTEVAKCIAEQEDVETSEQGKAPAVSVLPDSDCIWEDVPGCNMSLIDLGASLDFGQGTPNTPDLGPLWLVPSPRSKTRNTPNSGSLGSLPCLSQGFQSIHLSFTPASPGAMAGEQHSTTAISAPDDCEGTQIYDRPCSATTPQISGPEVQGSTSVHADAAQNHEQPAAADCGPLVSSEPLAARQPVSLASSCNSLAGWCGEDQPCTERLHPSTLATLDSDCDCNCVDEGPHQASAAGNNRSNLEPPTLQSPIELRTSAQSSPTCSARAALADDPPITAQAHQQHAASPATSTRCSPPIPKLDLAAAGMFLGSPGTPLRPAPASPTPLGSAFRLAIPGTSTPSPSKQPIADPCTPFFSPGVSTTPNAGSPSVYHSPAAYPAISPALGPPTTPRNDLIDALRPSANDLVRVLTPRGSRPGFSSKGPATPPAPHLIGYQQLLTQLGEVAAQSKAERALDRSFQRNWHRDARAGVIWTPRAAEPSSP